VLSTETHGGFVADLKSFQQRARNNVWLALAEFAIVAGLFYADVNHHIYVSKTPYLFVLGWASLRLRGMRWKDVGLARPPSWRKALWFGVTVGIFMEALELFITQPLLARWLGKMPDLSDFAGMVGNLKMFLIYLILIWTLGVLGEELDCRGYLMNRVAGVFRDTKVAWVLSRIVVSVVFGCGHLDQRATGMI
jgi:membrane protease YdiL (CAAX protease family)